MGFSSTVGVTFACTAHTHFMSSLSIGSSAVIAFTRSRSVDDSDPSPEFPDVWVPDSDSKDKYLSSMEDEYWDPSLSSWSSSSPDGEPSVPMRAALT